MLEKKPKIPSQNHHEQEKNLHEQKENSVEKREREEIWLPIEKAMARPLPFYNEEIREKMIKEKPDYYGDPHGREEERGTLEIRVGMDEYFDLFGKMVEDNETILQYKEKFPIEFLKDVAKDPALANPEDRYEIIRRFFGVRDHNDWSIKYDGNDETMNAWLHQKILSKYSQDPKELERWGRSPHWWTDVSFIKLGGDAKEGEVGFQFDGAGTKTQEYEFFPNGSKYDKLQFNEMKRIADLIRQNPNVTDFEFKPGVGTIITPTWTREKTE